MQLIAGLQPRARFFLLLVPRMLAGRCTPTRAASYAVALADAGNHRLATWCWKRVIRSSAQYQPAHGAILDLCLRAGHQDAAVTFANSCYDGCGLMPDEAVRLTGNLILRDGFDAALKIYDRVLDYCGGDLASRSPAPDPPGLVDGEKLRSMLVQCARNGVGNTTEDPIYLSFARLCFSFGAFDTSARLFERVSKQVDMDALDRIAHAYALLRSDGSRSAPSGIEKLCEAPDVLTAGADWQVLLATVLFARGAEDAVSKMIESALRMKFGGHPDVELMAADCRAIVGHLWNCPRLLTFREGFEARIGVGGASGIRKIFVCGSGWSGSGAVYDALAEYDGLSEAPDTPVDRYMNAGTDNEMMFVQGPAGLGRLWRAARQELRLSRLDLWDTFRFHVLGSGAIGYSEHKTAKVTSNLLGHLGGRYTGLYRQTFEDIQVLPEDAPLAQLQTVLTVTTERLSARLVESRETATSGPGGCKCVVFNNAIFGPNIDMLDIFRNVRAAVVTRDPLDQYADRRSQDFKHWMKPSPFIPLYRSGRKAFQDRVKQLRPDLMQEVREVQFERFVLDAQYRQSVIEWLLQGQDVRWVRRRFEPERSARNIGIHARLLAPGEREVLEKELKRWRHT